MAPLGMGLAATVSGGMGSQEAVVIEDYMWEVATSGELRPLASGTISESHDTWDLDGNNYTPQTEASVSDEGYWDLDGTNIRPLDV